jgi:hypothetical protein
MPRFCNRHAETSFCYRNKCDRRGRAEALSQSLTWCPFEIAVVPHPVGRKSRAQPDLRSLPR